MEPEQKVMEPEQKVKEPQQKKKEPGQKKKRKLFFPILIGVIVLAAAAYGVNAYIYSLHHEDTDDAQVDGDINPISPRISGYINRINFIENQFVKQGDTLVMIDDRDLIIKVQQADAALQNAIATVQAMRANVTTAQANTNTSKTSIDQANIKLWQATQDYNRYKNLLAEKSVTQSQFDAVKANYDAAQAQLTQAQQQVQANGAQVSAAQQQIAVAQAQVQAKQADLDYAKLQLTYAVITAPVSGIISKKNIQPGQLIQAGTPMFSIVTDTNIYVVANFKETQMTDVREGQKVNVWIDAFPKEKINGTVYTISGATGARFSLLPPDNATGNFVKVVQRVPVKVKMDLPQDLVTRLRPGMSAKVSIIID